MAQFDTGRATSLHLFEHVHGDLRDRGQAMVGMTVFLVLPFTRLVHIWSGFASVSYLLRPYQLMRRR